jgi:hypothetical protein
MERTEQADEGCEADGADRGAGPGAAANRVELLGLHIVTHTITMTLGSDMEGDTSHATAGRARRDLSERRRDLPRLEEVRSTGQAANAT